MTTEQEKIKALKAAMDKTPLVDFYFIGKPSVILRIDKGDHRLYNIEEIPKLNESVFISGENHIVRNVRHEFDGEGNEVSHTIILSLENSSR